VALLAAFGIERGRAAADGLGLARDGVLKRSPEHESQLKLPVQSVRVRGKRTVVPLRWNVSALLI
jgi:hypothetical protein